jgi:hypothetical protein
MRRSYLQVIILSLCAAFVVSGCCAPGEALKFAIGNSTRNIELARPNALTKIVGYDYGTCYVKTETLIKKIPRLSIYAKSEEMIAVYYNSVNITPVGVFFTEIDPAHTRIEVASQSPDAREYVAKSVFAGDVVKDTDKLVIEVRQPVAGKY